jgi:hypothetical protein
MNRYLAIGISDENDLVTWSSEFEFEFIKNKPRNITAWEFAARNALLEKAPDIIPCRILIVKNDNVVDDFNVD